MSFTVWKSPRLVRKIVVLTTLSKLSPSALKTAAMLSNTRRVCAAISPGTIWPDLGSSGIWPLQKRNLPLRTACEYGPIAAGASFVETIFFMSPIVTANPTGTMNGRDFESPSGEEGVRELTESCTTGASPRRPTESGALALQPHCCIVKIPRRDEDTTSITAG